MAAVKIIIFFFVHFESYLQSYVRERKCRSTDVDDSHPTANHVTDECPHSRHMQTRINKLSEVGTIRNKCPCVSFNKETFRLLVVACKSLVHACEWAFVQIELGDFGL